MGKYEIKKDKAGEFRFDLKASNGQIILSSEAYRSKPSCMNGIEAVRSISQSDDRFERRQTATGYHFDLKSNNGQILGVSKEYKTEISRENGISSVQKYAPDAIVAELRSII